MDWTIAADVVKTLASLVVVLGSVVAYLTYRRSVRTRRAEWLSSLHERFFESGRYDRVRQALDYKGEPDYSTLKSAISGGTSHPLANELYRYLNFFELLASLRQLGQISNDEILALFQYDLTMLTHHPFIIDSLEPEGFERLPQLLRSTKVLAPQ